MKPVLSVADRQALLIWRGRATTLGSSWRGISAGSMGGACCGGAIASGAWWRVSDTRLGSR